MSSWDNYRKRRRLFLIALLGFFPFALLVMFPLSYVCQSDTLGYRAGLAYLVFYGIASLQFAFFPCPKCGKSFFVKWWYNNFFTRQCVHCGFPKWAEIDKPEAG
jgi:hypothetical protein